MGCLFLRNPRGRALRVLRPLHAWRPAPLERRAGVVQRLGTGGDRVGRPDAGRGRDLRRAAEAAPMRLGRISYVNMAPVFYGLEADVEEVTGVPTELSRMLLDGEIDIAPIPSIEYARNADRLRILPRVCVSSEGAVDSIQLVTRMSFGQVRSVAVTPESATSVVLVAILPPKDGYSPSL